MKGFVKLLLMTLIVGFLFTLGNTTYESKVHKKLLENKHQNILPIERVVNYDLESDKSVALSKKNLINIKILAVGDIMMHGPQIRSGYYKATNTYNFNSFFETIKTNIETADFAIANLETTLGGKNLSYSGYPRFNSPDKIIDALKYAGFDAIVTANNHSLDTYIKGLIRTNEIIKNQGLDPIGTSNNSFKEKYLIKNIKGIEIAIIGYTQHVNGLENSYSSETLDPLINIIDEDQIISDIKKIKEHKPDLILVYMHWGNEYAKNPSDFQIYYANLLAKAGVDIIIGSHPHVIQRSEIIKTKNKESVVFYSLGNFISNQRRETLGDGYEVTEDGVIVSLDIQKNLTKNKTTIQKKEIIPTWVDRNRNYNESTFSYQILPIESYLSRNKSLNEDLYRSMSESLNRTQNRVNISE